MHRPVAALAAITAVVALGAAPAAASTTSTTSTTSTYRGDLTARLAKEWHDPALATSVVATMSPGLITSLMARVPAHAVATSAFFDYTPPRVPAKSVHSVLAFAFGWRVGANGAIEAGPVNQALAATTMAFVRAHPRVHVYAQTGIAETLIGEGAKGVVTIAGPIGANGQPGYIDTLDVARQAMAKAEAAGVTLGTVGVIAFRDHAARASAAAQKAGLSAGVPSGVVLPQTYDPESAQASTRTRGAYLVSDLLGRLIGD